VRNNRVLPQLFPPLSKPCHFSNLDLLDSFQGSATVESGLSDNTEVIDAIVALSRKLWAVEQNVREGARQEKQRPTPRPYRIIRTPCADAMPSEP